jgi:hypothetical protein
MVPPMLPGRRKFGNTIPAGDFDEIVSAWLDGALQLAHEWSPFVHRWRNFVAGFSVKKH